MFQVVALGLWGNYSSSHRWIPHPSAEMSTKMPADMLVEAISQILPDGYSKRLKKSCADILSMELKRMDASDLYTRKYTKNGTLSSLLLFPLKYVFQYMDEVVCFDLKKQYGLPTYYEKDAIYAYHFYRLLHRARDISLLYTTESSGIGSKEKSRFESTQSY